MMGAQGTGTFAPKLGWHNGVRQYVVNLDYRW